MAGVVFIAGRDPRSHTGCSHGVYLRTHSRAAMRAGYEAHLVCLAARTEREETDFGTVHAIATGWETHRQNRIPVFSPLLAERAAAVARALGRGGVVLHGVGVWGHAAAAADARIGARALVQGAYTTHLDETASQWRGLYRGAGWRAHARIAFELLWSRAVVSHYEAAAHRRARRVLVNYRTVQRMVERRFGVAAEIVPYTVEQELAAARPPPRAPHAPGPARIVCVARHDPRKGIDVLLRALLGLRRAGISFSATLIGGGVQLEANRRLAGALGLGGCVEILGTVRSVEPHLAEADIFALPSREEQSGSLALIEAMRAGLPCIASGCDGIPEDATHLEDAWLAAPGDADALTRGLCALISDRALREKLASGARCRFEQRFSAGAMSAALDRIYREVLAEARAGVPHAAAGPMHAKNCHAASATACRR